MTDEQRYPLAWPTGWKRTPYHQRRRAAFHATKTVFGSARADGSRPAYKQKDSLSVGQALDRLTGELGRLGAARVVISSNLRVRQDGLPYSQQAKQLDDPGVAIYFRLEGKPRALACDKWLSAAENIAAIAGHISAIRAVDRYGVGTLDQAFAGYAALPPVGGDWRTELGFEAGQSVDREAIDSRYRALAAQRHPDKAGGSHDAMTRLNAAREAATNEVSK